MFNCCKPDIATIDPPSDMCPLHPSVPIQKVCIENRCLEPLCNICQSQHLKIHQMLSTQPKLMNSEIVKHYALQECQRQIRMMQKQSTLTTHQSDKQKIMDMVDEFFYGSRNVRLGVLRQRELILLNQPTIGNVISVLLDEHKYIVPKNFENTLAMFLDKNLIFHNI